MDQYSSAYVSVVPRLLPSQLSPKKFPLIDEHIDNRPLSSHVNPSNEPIHFGPISTKAQLLNNDINNEDTLSYNPLNNLDNSLKGRTKNDRIHLEPLKDNSGDFIQTNSFGGDFYTNNNLHSSEYNKYPNILFIIIGIIIGLFSITALSISIYLLVKIKG